MQTAILINKPLIHDAAECAQATGRGNINIDHLHNCNSYWHNVLLMKHLKGSEYFPHICPDSNIDVTGVYLCHDVKNK